jgi:hypothetical protein
LHSERPVKELLPDSAIVRARLGNALREVALLRRLLRLAKVAEAGSPEKADCLEAEARRERVDVADDAGRSGMG